MSGLFQDLRYALRMLRNTPGLTAITVLTLALGIGANTAIFSLVDAVMLKRLPVDDPRGLVVLTWDADKPWPPNVSQTGRESRYSFSYPQFAELAKQEEVLSSTFAFAPLGTSKDNATVSIDGVASLASGMMVTGDYFSGLRVEPLVGRSITRNDEGRGAPRVVVISYGYWTRRFARDPAVVGRNISINGHPFDIVGVTPPAFTGVMPGSKPDFWIAFDDEESLRPWSQKPAGSDSVFTAPDWICLNVMARLKPGVTIAGAQSVLDNVYRQLLTRHWTPARPEEVPGLVLTTAPQGVPYLRRMFSEPLTILMIAVGLLLLVACANVATLLLARATARQREVSIRLALGASRGRLLRQLLTESVLMAVAGGAIGLLFATWGTYNLLELLATSPEQVSLNVEPDRAVLLFTLVVSIVTGILFGLAPALRSLRSDIASSIRDTAASVTTSRDTHRLGNALVVGQVAVSLVLLTGAGLFFRTLVNLRHNDFGFDQSRLLTFGLDPTRNGYHGARLVDFYSNLRERLSKLPGVSSASLIEFAPLSNWSNNSGIEIIGSSRPDSSEIVRFQMIGPDFFRTMGVPVVLGRPIDDRDTTGRPMVAVVDDTFVKTFLNDENPIGRQFTFPGAPAGQFVFNIVGVAAPVELTDVHAKPIPKAYVSYAQNTANLRAMFFEVRTVSDPLSVVSGIRELVHGMDPEVPLMALKTQSDLLDEALIQERLFARLSSLFGMLAMLLPVIGLYGTMAYSVARQTHEIGIRITLGARPASLVGLVVGQGARLAGLGVAIGVPVALAATSLLRGVIFGVAPGDPWTLGGSAILLTLVALVACFVPARRATKIDPMQALRVE